MYMKENILTYISSHDKQKISFQTNSFCKPQSHVRESNHTLQFNSQNKHAHRVTFELIQILVEVFQLAVSGSIKEEIGRRRCCLNGKNYERILKEIDFSARRNFSTTTSCRQESIEQPFPKCKWYQISVDLGTSAEYQSLKSLARSSSIPLLLWTAALTT